MLSRVAQHRHWGVCVKSLTSVNNVAVTGQNRQAFDAPGRVRQNTDIDDGRAVMPTSGMTEQERALVRKLYELQLELFDHQGDEIDALRRANESLRKSHDVIGNMLKLTAELAGFS
jgi:hypothetical protein